MVPETADVGILNESVLAPVPCSSSYSFSLLLVDINDVMSPFILVVGPWLALKGNLPGHTEKDLRL